MRLSANQNALFYLGWNRRTANVLACTVQWRVLKALRSHLLRFYSFVYVSLNHVRAQNSFFYSRVLSIFLDVILDFSSVPSIISTARSKYKIPTFSQQKVSTWNVLPSGRWHEMDNDIFKGLKLGTCHHCGSLSDTWGQCICSFCHSLTSSWTINSKNALPNFQASYFAMLTQSMVHTVFKCPTYFNICLAGLQLVLSAHKTNM